MPFLVTISSLSAKIKLEKINEELATAFRKKRNKLRKSQEEIADKAEIDRSYFSEIECGKVSVSVGIAHRIAKALNTSLSRIMKEVESKL
jgi:transcriptional regulator with XRE-family HTH domain